MTGYNEPVPYGIDFRPFFNKCFYCRKYVKIGHSVEKLYARMKGHGLFNDEAEWYQKVAFH